MAEEDSKSKRRSAGQPTAYRVEYNEVARQLCENGATDADLADFFRVNRSTIIAWRNRHPGFLNSMQLGAASADDRVERALYERAVGFKRKGVKVFLRQDDSEPVIAEYDEEVVPDVSAARLWLMNRRPDKWRDRTDVTHGIDQDSPIAKLIEACSGTGFRPKEEE